MGKRKKVLKSQKAKSKYIRIVHLEALTARTEEAVSKAIAQAKVFFGAGIISIVFGAYILYNISKCDVDAVRNLCMENGFDCASMIGLGQGLGFLLGFILLIAGTILIISEPEVNI